ncbi:MAG: hypothetical protein Q7R83_01825 [bacterium]|nr:hypothetical protein [bacterium]
MIVFLRSILFSIPRHLCLQVALFAVDNFEFSPLPAWTGWVVTVVFFLAITYFFAEWVLIHRTPGWKEMLTVFLTFLIFGTFFEAATFVYIGGFDWSDVPKVMTWQSIYMVILYGLSVWAAGFRVRRRQIRNSMPDGLES